MSSSRSDEQRTCTWTSRSANDRRMQVDEFDSGKMLAHAARQAKQRGYDKFPIVDVDSHHYELESFNEILEYMTDPVMKQLAQMANSGNSKGVGVMPGGVGYQDMGGRVIALSAAPDREAGARRAPRRLADAALDGRDGRRHRGAVPLADAAARPASAGRGRGRAVAGLQPLALRARAGGGERASARCCICRSTIRRRATGW